MLEEIAGQSIHIDLQAQGKSIRRTQSWTDSAVRRAFDRLMEFQRVSPESLVAESIEAEDLSSLPYQLDRVGGSRIVRSRLTTSTVIQRYE